MPCGLPLYWAWSWGKSFSRPFTDQCEHFNLLHEKCMKSSPIDNPLALTLEFHSKVSGIMQSRFCLFRSLVFPHLQTRSKSVFYSVCVPFIPSIWSARRCPNCRGSSLPCHIGSFPRNPLQLSNLLPNIDESFRALVSRCLVSAFGRHSHTRYVTTIANFMFAVKWFLLIFYLHG